MSNYLLDANCFIQAHRERYPIDVANSFWDKVKELANKDIIVSIDKVHGELFDNTDPLTRWIDYNLDGTFFNETEIDPVLQEYQKVANWAQSKSNQYLPKAIEDFLEYDNADAWLIAYAYHADQTIVTYEVSSPDSKNIIKIPDACSPFNVQCVDPMEMLRDLGETF